MGFAILGVATLGPVPIHAQVRASEHAMVSQTVDGTVFTVEYFRPQVRGRTSVFGNVKVVAWGEVWTPGANWATTFEVNRDVTIDGHPVPKGKYTVWLVVRRDAWTMVLDPRFPRYHEERPDSTADQVRWTVHPGAGGFTEVLTWSFPEVRPDGGRLLLAWGTTQLALDFTVPAKYPVPVSRAIAEPILGRYEWQWADDTSRGVSVAEFYYEEGMVKQRYTPFPAWYARLQNQPMIRINDGWFMPSIMKEGRITEMASDMVFEFAIKDGVAVSFEMRDDHDNLLASGRRVPH